MPTPERCLAQAAEAERLASIVSYERDRVRLLRQAEELRARAAELEATPPAPEPQGRAALLDRVRLWLRRPTTR